jgi:hypothetical protein
MNSHTGPNVNWKSHLSGPNFIDVRLASKQDYLICLKQILHDLVQLLTYEFGKSHLRSINMTSNLAPLAISLGNDEGVSDFRIRIR